MIKIRYGVFETNSSSVHSLIMCSDNEYQKFVDNELLYDLWNEELITYNKALDKLYKNVKFDTDFKYHFNLPDDFSRDKLNDFSLGELEYYLASEASIYTCNYFFNELEYNTYEDTYRTIHGEIVHAFGYYGHD